MDQTKFFKALGLMSGTSLDGMDAAIIETDGYSIHSFGPFESKKYEPDFRERLKASLGSKFSPRDLEREITELHAELIKELLAEHGISVEEIDLIGFHGQTIHHEPENQLTVQLGDGALLAELTGCAVVNDFRAADVAAGGEGAPFAPVFHQALAQKFEKPVAFVNIGGVGNVTYIERETLIAFDTGPGNALIDDFVSRREGWDFDDDGKCARQGRVDQTILTGLMDNPYFSKKPPKSLDRNDFDFSAIEALSMEDGAATLLAFTVQTLAAAADHFPTTVERWLVTGGGRHNSFMMEELAKAVDGEVAAVESHGWNGDAIEAQAFAFMAVRSQLGLPISFPTTTGIKEPLTGGIFHPRP